MNKRETIRESAKAIIEKVNGAEDYKYWVYEITPIKEEKIDGITFVSGGNSLWHGMYKTLEEALKEFDELERHN